MTDEQLVDACRRGDAQAFQELVERHKGQVFALIARSVADRNRAEDLAQDVFLRIYRGLPYFRGESRLSTWIYRIVANVCAQEAGRRPAPASLDDEKHPPVLPAAVDRQFSDLELRQRLEKAIARLPANQRLLVAAHYLDGVQYRGSGGGAEPAARDGEDAPLPREAAAAQDARNGLTFKALFV